MGAFTRKKFIVSVSSTIRAKFLPAPFKYFQEKKKAESCTYTCTPKCFGIHFEGVRFLVCGSRGLESCRRRRRLAAFS